MSTARRVRSTVLAVAFAVASGATLEAQDASVAAASRETEQIVVMIRCTLDGEPSIGAGILVGMANDRLYVVTANHVVRRGATEATDIRLELRGLPGEPVAAAPGCGRGSAHPRVPRAITVAVSRTADLDPWLAGVVLRV